MIRQGLAVLALAVLAGCAGEGQQRGAATPDEVARAAYRHDGPPSLTLYTVINNRSETGGHAALMINASQRVIFDPAGSFHHADTPRRGDVLYGITPPFRHGYESMHARETHHVVAHEVQVSPEVAEQALRLAQSYGPVSQTQCAVATANVLRELPGFENVRSTLYPGQLMRSFEAVTGAEPRKYYEDFTPPAAG